jgi:hypothetical protein
MVMRAGTGLIVLIGHATHEILALNFIQSFRKVTDFLDSHEPPFLAKLYRPDPVDDVQNNVPGRITLSLSYAEWKAGQGKS